MPVEKTKGDLATISAMITNTGNVDVTFRIQAGISGLTGIVGATDHLIPVGQTSQVSFPFITDEVGTFDVTVSIAYGGQVLDTKTLPGELVVKEALVYSAQIVSVTVS